MSDKPQDFEALLSEFERTCNNYAANRAAYAPALQELEYVQECKEELRAYVKNLEQKLSDYQDAETTDP